MKVLLDHFSDENYWKRNIGSKLNLSTAERGTGPDSEDREDAHQEGEDRREQEAPPSPLPETSP